MARKVGGSLPVGYGGSAAAASHFAADLGKMATLSEGARFRVHSLVDNVAWTTAVGNDIDFEAVFVEQLRNLARRADRLVAFSTSGRSANVGYTRTELVESVDELEHELVRECLRKTGMLQGVEISTMGDVPSAGSGLGSSSTVTVGLLNAMYGYSGRRRSRVELAQEACEIEIDVLSKPIGVEDQYIVSLGGFRRLSFEPDGEVRACPVELRPEYQEQLEERLMLFYANQTRKAESVLAEQEGRIEANFGTLTRMRDLVDEGIEALQKGALDTFGSLLHRSWQLKKGLAPGISNGGIDSSSSRALEAGALGGKITGAGGGGFLLLYCPPRIPGECARGPERAEGAPFRFRRGRDDSHPRSPTRNLMRIHQSGRGLRPRTPGSRGRLHATAPRRSHSRSPRAHKPPRRAAVPCLTSDCLDKLGCNSVE